MCADRWPKKNINGILNLQSQAREKDEGGAGGIFLSPIYMHYFEENNINPVLNEVLRKYLDLRWMN
jgi:hypothetical protein